jgi:hypothetical protein
VEAYLALKNRITNPQLEAAVQERRKSYRHKSVAGIYFDLVYADFA